jgi:DNA polymerase III delta subunit
MKRTNIVFFTGNNTVFLKRELDRWIESFRTKYGEHNISRIRGNVTNIEQELLSPPFFGEKRLVILEDVPSASYPEKSEDGSPSKEGELEEKILKLFDRIPDSTFALFVQPTPDKRHAFVKRLISEASIKTFQIPENTEMKAYILDRLPNLAPNAVPRLMAATHGDMMLLESEIEKLSLTFLDKPIGIPEIEQLIIPHMEISIFALTDALISGNVSESLAVLDRLIHVENHNIHQIFAATLSTLRNFLYVGTMLSRGCPPARLSEFLTMHPFVLKKHIDQKKSFSALMKFFSTLVALDRKTKTGEGIGDARDELLIGLEHAILLLKK